MSKGKESLILIINVSISSKESQINPYLLDKIKAIAQCIIEKKIFYRPKDEIGIILIGTNTTCDKSQFININTTNMQMPNWEIIRTISNLQHTNHPSNWIEILCHAIDYIKRECISTSLKTVVLFSNFEQVPNINRFDTNNIIKKLMDQRIKLLAIGSESLLEKSQMSITSSEKVFLNICKQVNGMYRTIDEALDDMRFITKAQSKPLAIPFTLEILDLEIPVKSYVKVKKEIRLPAWRFATDIDSQSETIKPKYHKKVVRTKELLNRHREIHKLEKTVRGYMYGGVFTVFTAEDERAMLYKSGPKSYKFLSMTQKDKVSIQYWRNSSSTCILLPANQAVAPQFYSLLQAMNDGNVVAIVRKVSRKDSVPNIVVLFPRINIPDEPWCFVEIKLPFAEDTRIMESKSLMSYVKQLLNEQNEMINDFLDSFKSTKINDPCEEKKRIEFMPGYIPNPMKQHMFNMLSYRALNPEKQLPTTNALVKQLLEPCKLAKEKTLSPIQQIKLSFDFNNSSEATISKYPENFTTEGQSLSTIKNSSSTMDNDSSEEPVLLLDTSDIDIDQLVADI